MSNADAQSLDVLLQREAELVADLEKVRQDIQAARQKIKDADLDEVVRQIELRGPTLEEVTRRAKQVLPRNAAAPKQTKGKAKSQSAPKHYRIPGTNVQWNGGPGLKPEEASDWAIPGTKPVVWKPECVNKDCPEWEGRLQKSEAAWAKYQSENP